MPPNIKKPVVKKKIVVAKKTIGETKQPKLLTTGLMSLFKTNRK